MKNRPLWALLSLVAMTAGTASCQCSGGKPTSAVETLAESNAKLPNGLRIDLVAGPCGDGAALVVLFDTGINHDPPGRSGMTELAARVLASSAPAGRAPRTVLPGTDYVLYSVPVAAGDKLLAEIDEVAAWMAKGPPAEVDLAKARAPMIEHLARSSGADAALTAMSLAEEAVKPTRGNGKRHGIAAEIEAITLADLQAFWKAAFSPGNARLTVAGRFDAKAVRARVEAALGPLAASPPPPLREGAEATVRGTLVMGEAPAAVAIAVPAPPLKDPLYTPFLMLAARLMEKPAAPRAWEVSYDPIARPELLFITAPIPPTERPEPAAAKVRAEVESVLARPSAQGDAAKAREVFRALLEPKSLDPKVCARDARAFATARARKAQLEIEALAPALETISKAQLDEAAQQFDAKHSAAMIR